MCVLCEVSERHRKSRGGEGARVKVLVEGVRGGPLNNVNRTFKWRTGVPTLTYNLTLINAAETSAH